MNAVVLRCSWICGNQQRRFGMDRNVHHFSACRVVLRRDQRRERVGSLYWIRVSIHHPLFFVQVRCVKNTVDCDRITVSGGTFTATVAARSAIAIHTGALGTGAATGSSTGSGTSTSGTVSVTFQETATTTLGEVIAFSFVRYLAHELLVEHLPIWKHLTARNVGSGVSGKS
jgi:hypothetical protein